MYGYKANHEQHAAALMTSLVSSNIVLSKPQTNS